MTLYTIDLSSESAPSVPVTVSTVQSRQTVPHPAKLSQNVDALFFLWTGDLLAPLAALPANQRKQIREVKVRVKTPTPKLLNLATPEGFEAHHPAGSATLTFTSKPGVDFSTLPPQVSFVPFSLCPGLAAADTELSLFRRSPACTFSSPRQSPRSGNWTGRLN